MKNVYKFVGGEIKPLEEYKNARPYILLEKLNNGEKLSREEKQDSIFSELWHAETYQKGIYRLDGWAFDFCPYMKRFTIRDKYHGWREVRAFDKTAIRQNACTPSHILEIVEIKLKGE